MYRRILRGPCSDALRERERLPPTNNEDTGSPSIIKRNMRRLKRGSPIENIKVCPINSYKV